MIVQCTNCYNDVIPFDNGICPACRELVAGKPQDPNRTAVWFYSDQQLPPYCIHCGKSTSTRQHFLNKAKSGGDSGISWVIEAFCQVIVGLFTGILFMANGSSKRKVTYCVGLAVPVCNGCSKGLKVVEPLRVDYPGERVQLMVHNSFLAKLED